MGVHKIPYSMSPLASFPPPTAAQALCLRVGLPSRKEAINPVDGRGVGAETRRNFLLAFVASDTERIGIDTGKGFEKDQRPFQYKLAIP